MCYSKPGPRCSGHTWTEYEKAKAILVKALNDGVNEIDVTPLQARERNAWTVWLKTPDGIEHLNNEGEHQLANIYEHERVASVRAYQIDQEVRAGKEDQRLEAGFSVRTSSHTLDFLAEDKSHHVRRAVANNLQTNEAALVKLTHDERREVRATLATRVPQYASVLSLLYKDEHPYIRECVASNPYTNVDTLRHMIHDDSPSVRACAVASCSELVDTELDKLIKDRDVHVRTTLAAHINDPDVLRILSQDAAINVREAVAYNRATSVRILTELSSDVKGAVREGVACNLRTPEEVRSSLAYDENISVVRLVARHSKDPLALRHLRDHKDDAVRRYATTNPLTTKDERDSYKKTSALNIRGPEDKINKLNQRIKT